MDFLKKVSYVFVNKYIGLLFELISSILLVRYLGPEDYGQYISLYLLPILIGSLGALGFGPSIVYHINKDELCIRDYLYKFTLLGLILGFFFLAIIVSMFGFINDTMYEGGLDNNLFRIAVLFVPIIITQKYLRSIIRGLYNIKVFSLLLDVVAPILRLLLILIVLDGSYGLIGIVIVPVAVQAIITLYMFFYLFKQDNDVSRVGTMKLSYFIVISKFALKNYIGSALQKSSSDIVMLIASILLTFKDVGMLSLAQKLLQAITGLSNAVLTVLMPKVSRSTTAEIKGYVTRVTSIMFSFNILALSIYLIMLDLVVILMYGDEFIEVSTLSIPLGIAAIFLPLSNILLLVVTFTGDPMKKAYARGLGLIVNLSLCYPLFILYGAIGFAISIGIGQVAIFFMSLFFFLKKITDIQISKIFILKLSDVRYIFSLIKHLKKEGVSKS